VTHACPPAQEASFRTFQNKLPKCAWRVPVCKSDCFVFLVSTEGDDEASQDENDKGNDLDCTCAELNFAKPSDVEALSIYQSDWIWSSLNKVLLTLIKTTTVAKTAIQIETFRSGRQYWMINPAAVTFVGAAIIYLKK
jgi:hypothetical protein